jgi:hypothetical protein
MRVNLGELCIEFVALCDFLMADFSVQYTKLSSLLIGIQDVRHPMRFCLVALSFNGTKSPCFVMRWSKLFEMEDMSCRISISSTDRTLLLARIDTMLSSERLNSMARQAGCLERCRKIHPLALIKSLCLVTLQSACSLRMCAILLGMISGKRISKQALWKRINPQCPQFIRAALFHALLNVSKLRDHLENATFASFTRVLIQDSTQIAFPKKLANDFPGAGNQTGRPTATASIQTVYDALAETFVFFKLTPFTQNDQSAAPTIITLARKGDLILRDLGYFGVENLHDIDRKEAYYVTRYRYGTSLFLPSGEKLDLFKQLHGNSSLDMRVLVGNNTKLPARLVAKQVPERIANERRRKLLNNRDRRRNPTKDQLALMDWEIFLTNVTEEIWDSDTVSSVYGIRWRIEIIFKSWKSHFHFTTLTNGSKAFVECLIYSRLLLITLFHSALYRSLCEQVHHATGKYLSLLKTAQFVAEYYWLLFLAAASPEYATMMLQQIVTHCTYERRRNRLNYHEIMALLSLS